MEMETYFCPHVAPIDRVGDEAGFCVACLRRDLASATRRANDLEELLRAALKTATLGKTGRARCESLGIHVSNQETRERLRALRGFALFVVDVTEYAAKTDWRFKELAKKATIALKPRRISRARSSRKS